MSKHRIYRLITIFFLAFALIFHSFGVSASAENLVATVYNAEELNEAIAAAQSGDVIGISGSIRIPKGSIIGDAHKYITLRRMSRGSGLVTTYGIDATGADAITLIQGITFDGNSSTVGGTAPALTVEGTVEIVECDFIACMNDGGAGGAILITSQAALTVRACTFTDGNASTGAHIYSMSNKPLIIEDSRFTNGWADNRGGSICCGLDASSISLKNSIIRGNHADEGGGIYTNGSLTVEDSIAYQNEANTQGADLIVLGAYNDTTTEEQYNSYLNAEGLYYKEWADDTNTSVGCSGACLKLITTTEAPSSGEADPTDEPTGEPTGEPSEGGDDEPTGNEGNEPSEPSGEDNTEGGDDNPPENTEPSQSGSGSPTEGENTDGGNEAQGDATEPSESSGDGDNSGSSPQSISDSHNTADSHDDSHIENSGNTDSHDEDRHDTTTTDNSDHSTITENSGNSSTVTDSHDDNSGSGNNTTTDTSQHDSHDAEGSYNTDNHSTQSTQDNHSTTDNHSSEMRDSGNTSTVSNTDNSRSSEDRSTTDNSSYTHTEDNSYRDSSTTSYYYYGSEGGGDAQRTIIEIPQYIPVGGSGGSQPVTVSVPVTVNTPEGKPASEGGTEAPAAQVMAPTQNIKIQAEGVNVSYESTADGVSISITAPKPVEAAQEPQVVPLVYSDTRADQEPQRAAQGSYWLDSTSVILLIILVLRELKDLLKKRG